MLSGKIPAPSTAVGGPADGSGAGNGAIASPGGEAGPGSAVGGGPIPSAGGPGGSHSDRHRLSGTLLVTYTCLFNQTGHKIFNLNEIWKRSKQVFPGCAMSVGCGRSVSN